MIKKIAFLIIIAVTIYGLYTVITEGMTIAFISIPSYSELEYENEQLDNKISTLENIRNTKYGDNELKLEAAKKSFETAQKTYENLVTLASPEEIADANKREEYVLDYLWIKLGNYASDNNIKIQINHIEEASALSIDVTGAYISIINFIYDIEDDIELGLTVNNIIMEGGSSDTITKANFTIQGVNIVSLVNEEE